MIRSRHVQHLRAVQGSEPGEGVEARPDEALDLQCVRRAAAGDTQAWARLYQRHFDRIYRDVLYLVEVPANAEEIVQETFALALVALGRFDARASVVTWLRGIAHNLVRRHWRTHVRRGRAYQSLGISTPLVGTRSSGDPERTHATEQRAEILSAVLETLPASLREVFVLRDVQGLEVDEVADRLGITAGNVRVRANRARAKIKDALQRLGWIEEEGS